MDVEKARRLLEERLADLERSTRVLSAEDEAVHEGSGDISHIHQHPGDQASEVFDQEREDAIVSRAQADRAEIEAALQRLEDGSYGRCVDCGRPIPDERLEARPEVRRCLDDQRRYEERLR